MSLILFLADWNVEKMIAEIHNTHADRRDAAAVLYPPRPPDRFCFPPDLVSLIKSTAPTEDEEVEGEEELMAGGCVTTDSECRLLSRQLWMERRSDV